jgi:hypothetical protein
MNQKTIIVELDEFGNSSIDLLHFAGKGCAKTAADFTGSDKVTKTVVKREYAIEPVKQTTKVNQ